MKTIKTSKYIDKIKGGRADNKNPIDLMRVAQDVTKGIDKEASYIFGLSAHP